MLKKQNKVGNPGTCDNMDEPGGYYPTWTKPDRTNTTWLYNLYEEYKLVKLKEVEGVMVVARA